MKKMKSTIAYADVGSNGGIFMFWSGPIYDKHPTLLHIYADRLSPDLVPVLITPLKAKSQKKAKR